MATLPLILRDLPLAPGVSSATRRLEDNPFVAALCPLRYITAGLVSYIQMLHAFLPQDLAPAIAPGFSFGPSFGHDISVSTT
jgi:hypothetical protein